MITIQKKTYLLVLCILSFLVGCAPKIERQANRMFKKGNLIESSPQSTVGFSTIRSLIVVPVSHNGVHQNFIFDTGAMVSMVRKDFKEGETLKVGGASNRKIDVGFENIASFKIGNADFQETFAATNPLDGLKDSVPNFGGLIGQPIISRANWLIDYPQKKLTVSTSDLADESYTSIKIKREEGAPYTTLTVNGVSYKCIIDLGASSAISIPTGSPLASYVLSSYTFQETEREVWTIGGSKLDKELISVLPNFELGGIAFKNVEMNVKESSQLRVGMPFFKEYKVYIDNTNGDYKIKK